MALRWCAADVAEASKQFRRVNGHLHRPEPHRHVGYDNVEPDGNIQDVSGA